MQIYSCIKIEVVFCINRWNCSLKYHAFCVKRYALLQLLHQIPTAKISTETAIFGAVLMSVKRMPFGCALTALLLAMLAPVTFRKVVIKCCESLF